MEWANVLLQGVLIGGLYAMFAAGLSLIFGVMRMVNIAHGDLIVLAAYLALVVVDMLGLNPIAAILVVAPLMAIIGYALQVGLLNRVFVYRVENDSPTNAVINPVIEWSSSEKEVFEEGCLSLPSVHVDVERPLHIRVTAQDIDGEPIVIEASGLEARVIQHETDHLDGVLILDRISRGARKDAMRAMREALEERDAQVA